MPGPRLESAYRVETPEGVELALRTAGPVPRGLALSIDTLIRWGVTLSVSIPLASFGQLGTGGLLVAVFLLEWFYPVAFEVWGDGQTPGKRALGLRVVHADATPVGFGASLVRNLLRVADFLPVFYVTGIAASCANARFQRLGDLAAGTLVIHVAEVDEDAAAAPIDPGGPLPAPVPLRPHEQRALLAFADRAGSLSPERRAELAGFLGEVTGATGEAGVRTLLRIARGLSSRA